MSRSAPRTPTERADLPTEQTAVPPSTTQTAAPADTPLSATQTAAPADTQPPAAQTAAPTVCSDWYTDTLRAIVRRALDSDKPDIKGALAALQLLAEAEDTPARQEDDVARILRDARRRVIHGRQN